MKNTAIFLIAIFLFGCGSKTGDKSADSQASSEQKMEAAWSIEEVWRTDTLMKTCESVRYDELRQQLYVTCINGKPWEKDGQGFIGLLNMNGSIKTERWITGLDAPKGMGILEGKLYVADLDQVAVIDIEKAEVLKKIKIPGAEQLNDIAVDKNGKIYFSDSSTGWIWTLEDDKPVKWVEGAWERPNGLYIEDKRVLLASSGSQDLTEISLEDGSQTVLVTEIGHGDGVENIGKEGHYIVTSWSGEIFLILPDYSKLSLLKTSEEGINTADIGFNIAEQIIYVPTFFTNQVVAYRLLGPSE